MKKAVKKGLERHSEPLILREKFIRGCAVTNKRRRTATGCFFGFLRRKTSEWGSEGREFKSHRPDHLLLWSQRKRPAFRAVEEIAGGVGLILKDDAVDFDRLL